MEMPEQLFLVRCGPQRTGPERMVTCPVCLTIVETFQDRRQADGRCRHLTHGLRLTDVGQSTRPAGPTLDECRLLVMIGCAPMAGRSSGVDRRGPGIH